MVEPLNLRNLAWVLTAMLKALLLFYLLRRRLHRSYPIFFSYLVATILQDIVLASAYERWDFQSLQSWNLYWGTQGVVVGARWLAIAEITRKIFASYSGLSKLASHFLFLVGVGVLAYSVAASQGVWQTAVLRVDRAVELSIAGFLASLFLFARYYRLPIAALESHLAVGFSLYSCFWVINTTMLVHWGTSFDSMRSFLEILTFFATLLLWISAVRKHTEAEAVTVPVLVSPETYAKLSLVANSRLHQLNERLNHLLHTEDSRS
jgi:hypothetical protein